MEMQREQRAMQAEDEDAMEAEAAAQPTAQQHQDGIGAWVDFRSAEDAERAVASAAAVGPGVAEPAKMIKAVEVLKALLARARDVDAETARGSTALALALDKGHLDCVRALASRISGTEKGGNRYWTHRQPLGLGVPRDRSKGIGGHSCMR